MLRSRILILAVLFAAVLWGAGLAPVSENDLAVATVSTRLTDAEADCIVGGQQGCVEAGGAAYDQCMTDNFNPFSPSAGTTILKCGGVGAWTTVACVVSWFWSLFF